MAKYDALVLEVIGEARPLEVRVPEGNIEVELQNFLNRTAPYETGWIRVHGDEEKYVRYERIASVTVWRGQDDEHVPVYVL